MSRFILGQWLVVCDRCGVKRLASQVQETWDGLIVCSPRIKNGCFETRHPQDFIKQIKDDSSVPFVRSRAPDQFITVTYTDTYCSVTGRYCQADFAEADCAIVDTVNGNFLI